MRIAKIVLILALLPSALAAQVGRRGGAPRLEQGMNRRANLERQVLQRFVEQSSRDMGLSAPARTRLQQLLNESNARRRELGERGADLRARLMTAVRDDNTSDDEFRSLLSEIDALREQEHERWREDQTALAKELTPRQRAMFTARWLRFQETIRDMIERRQGAGRAGELRDPAPGFAPGGADDLLAGRRSRSPG